MKNATFKFYSVLKNEDAMPYIGGNLLVAADGLGGSGSSVHSIDRSKHQDLRGEIMSSALGDLVHVSPELLQYIEELIAPMTDGKDDTSALWASRIVIARCVYALTEGEFKDAPLDDKNVRADLAAFISQGLSRAVEQFGLQKGKYDNQLLLPTTLALIRYTEGEGSVIAETVWAGDSRLYALTPSGLKLLSVDDEDDSGSITNLFYASNQDVRLNYLRHEIRKPCALMAVSDGIFDPFDPHDHLGVEYTLLSAVSECDTEQELAGKLHAFFDDVHGDDATMAFVSFGFDDFADMKQVLKERTEKIGSIRQKQAELHTALEVMNLSEEEATHYVASRTADRYEHIIPMLIDAMERGINDIAITAELHNEVDKMRKAYKDAVEAKRRERLKRAFAALTDYVLSHPEDVLPQSETTILSDCGKSVQERTFTDFIKAAEDFSSQKKQDAELELRRQKLDTEKEELHRIILGRLDLFEKKFRELWAVRNPQSIGQRKRIVQIISGWHHIDNALNYDRVMLEKEIRDSLPLEEREWAITVQEHLDERKKWHTDRAKSRKKRNPTSDDYMRAWDKLRVRLKRNELSVDDLFRHEVIVKFGFVEPDDAVVLTPESIGDRVMREFNNRKSGIVSDIIQALAIGYDKSSVIDSQYNATKLDLFRAYYSLKNHPDRGIGEFKESLDALEAEYTSLVDHAEV